MLSGCATLHLGEDQSQPLVEGDHVVFKAGEPVAHHIENTSDETFSFLVYGERKSDDVVFYPEGKVVLVKSKAGAQQYTYRPRPVPD